MSNISLYKKIKLFYQYRSLIKKIKFGLENNFGARIDNAGRIYTVLNIPSSLIEEPYNLKTSDIDKISENYIREYSQLLSKYLNDNGLMEMYGFYEMKKVEKYSYLLVFGFAFFDSSKFYKNIYILLSVIISSLIFSAIIVNF